MGDANRQPHLGCTLSLISKANIRYEGILKGIDTDACTLTLNNVQSYGTEDRVPDKPIPPTPGTYDLIIFNGHDIQDVQVVQKEEVPVDPAILNAQKRVDRNNQPRQNNNQRQPLVANPPTQQHTQQPQPPISKPMRIHHDANKSAFSKPSSQNNNQSDNNNSSTRYNNRDRAPKSHNPVNAATSIADAMRNNKAFPGSASNGNAWSNRGGGDRSGSGQRVSKPRATNQHAPPTAAELAERKKQAEEKRKAELEKFKEEFDFTKGLGEFDKGKVAQELEKLTLDKKDKRKKSKDKDVKKKSNEEEDDEAAAAASDADSLNSGGPECYYDSKKSFFDNISCEATEARNREKNYNAQKKMMSRHEERKLNSETFGIPQYPTRNFRGGNSGGHRGGYQNNRGRGGYNNGGGRRDYNNGGGRGGYNNSNRGGYNSHRGSGNRQRSGQREWVNYNFDVNKARKGVET